MNVITVNDSLPNFSDNRLALINLEIKAVINFNNDNFSFNKDNYFFDDYNSLSHYDYHKNHSDGNNNDKSNTSLMVPRKKCI